MDCAGKGLAKATRTLQRGGKTPIWFRTHSRNSKNTIAKRRGRIQARCLTAGSENSVHCSNAIKKCHTGVEIHQPPDRKKCPHTTTELTLSSSEKPLWGSMNWKALPSDISPEVKPCGTQRTVNPIESKAPDPPTWTPPQTLFSRVLLRFHTAMYVVQDPVSLTLCCKDWPTFL